MSPTVEYHCLNCLDNTVSRDFDVSHLSVTCDACGEFGRFVNGHVLAKFREFEASPPDDLEWERLDRMEKFLVAERIVRKGHSLEDFEIEVRDDDEAETAVEDDGQPAEEGERDQTTDDGAGEKADDDAGEKADDDAGERADADADEETGERADAETEDRAADVDST